MRTKDYTGMRSGKLVAIKASDEYYIKADGIKRIQWEFQCDCGNTCTRRIEYVFRKIEPARSCGCLKPIKYRGFEAYVNQIFHGGDYDDSDLTMEDFYKLSQLPCFWCGTLRSNVVTAKPKKSHKNRIPWTFEYNGLDRLDSNLLHSKNNVVPCCWPCNNAKKNMNAIDWLEKCKRIASGYDVKMEILKNMLEKKSEWEN